MNAGAADDVFRTVEYSRDKWTMNRVPLALLGCFAGLALVAFIDPRPPGIGTFVLLAVLMAFGILSALASAIRSAA
jgi:hypothetical protein